MSNWAELIQGTQATAVVDGMTVHAQSMSAGALADCVVDGKPCPFRILAATITEPPITEAEARKLRPRVFARLVQLAEEVNGTDEDLE